MHVPERVLCTDNAAMIASAARFAPLPYPEYLALDVYATGERRGERSDVYSRPDCHLCEEAIAALRPLSRARLRAPGECDIALDDALQRRISSGSGRLLDGEELFEYFVDAALRELG